jgi:hypothetical protein
MLRISERRTLRSLHGPVKENGVWRSRYNHELYEVHNEPDIVRVAGTPLWNSGAEPLQEVELYIKQNVLDE